MAHHVHHKHLQQEKRDVSTILSVVYVTASPTFTGAIGGYITLDGSQSTTTQVANNAKGTPLQNTRASAASSASSAAAAKGTPLQNSRASSAASSQASSTPDNAVPSRQQRPTASTTSLSTATLIPSADTSDVAASTSMLLDTNAVPTSAAMIPATTLISSIVPAVAAISSTAAVPSSTASATSSPVAHATEGTSGGAKAGIAIGVILALALIAGLVFFFLRRRRNDQEDDHQHVHNEKAVAARQSSSSNNSSRFSLTKSVLSIPRLSLGPMMSEKQDRPELRHQDSLSNPFGDHNETVNPITDSQIKSLVASNVPAPLNLRPTTPNGMNTPASGRSSPAPPPQNVHRVQLDFKPSMDDELELRSGQLVRLLHEYDDGWALCKSWDRSQQGVVPRSCLSKLPLKPRAPPQNRTGSGRQVSGGHRNVSGGSVGSIASFASEESVPRPLSPAGRVRAQSSASAGPRQSGESTRPRSNSTGDAKALSPLNPAAAGVVVGRKPVPGQAI